MLQQPAPTLAQEAHGLRLSLFAPAKVNLGLKVRVRQENGYHQLDMLIGFAKSVGDGLEIALSASGDISFEIDGAFASALLEEDARLNLVTRAAKLFKEATGTDKGAHIHLTKNLPVASGIGGGSADAAAVLKGLQTLWQVSLPQDEFEALALKLGADVPMCLYGQPCHVGGIGETITPLKGGLPGVLLLINPNVRVSTRAVFEALDLSLCGQALPPLPTGFANISQLADYLGKGGNDLEAAAKKIAPVIGDCVSAIGVQENCLHAQMTGSGATCFGLFKDEAGAEKALSAILAENAGWWGAVSRIS